MRRPSMRRDFLRLPAGIALLLSAAGPGSALTQILEVTPQYLREHAKELSVKVYRREDGLLAFTIGRTVPERRYFVARLLVKRGGKTLAETSIPAYGQKDANSFHFALAPEILAESEFQLDEAHPARPRGWIGYQFRLREHVPEELRR
jgi:hypothetical protein